MEVVKSRKKNSLRNLVFGLSYQVLNLICSFVCRTVLIYFLGEQILGINSLYTNILSLLALAELGIGNIMLVKLYKPIAEGDKETITAYINYYKKIYHVIALIVFTLGLCFLPFLNFIVSDEVLISNQDLIIYFLIFLFNTVSSYFVVYKHTLINANQQSSILKTFNIFTLLAKTALRMVILFTIKDYRLYLLVDLVCNIIANVSISVYVSKKYPYLKNKNSLDNEKRKEIKIGIKDIFLYKIGGTLITNTDSIIISAMLGTTLVGYLSNYNLIITALTGFLSSLTSAIFASVGNMAVTSSKENVYKVFKSFVMAYHVIGAFCGITLMCVFNDFIFMWLGTKFMLGWEVVAALSFNFYFMTAITPVYIFRENFNLFSKAKYLFLIAAVINIVSSIILAYFLGLVGVILGTIICRMFTTFIFEPPYLCKTVFNRSSKSYFFSQIKMFVVTIISFIASYFICKFIPINIGLFFVKILVCFVITAVLFSLFFFKTDEYKYLFNTAKEIVANLKNKLKGKENKKQQTEASFQEDAQQVNEIEVENDKEETKDIKVNE